MKNNSGSILITGGAGFIGSEVVRQLSTTDRPIIIVDNLSNGKRSNVDSLLGERVRLEVEDVRDSDKMYKLMKGVGTIFHLACLGVRHSIHSPTESHEVNATATLSLLGLAKSLGAERFIYVSSSEVYGTARWAPMTEEHPTYPMTVYGAAKLAGETYTRAYYTTYGFPTVVVRPFNSFGPRCHHEGDSGEVIPKFMLRALAGRSLIVFGDGTQTRDYTYVSDTAKGIIQCGLSEEAVGNTINLGSGREISINDLAKAVLETVDTCDSEIIHDQPRPGDVLRLLASTERAKQLLGYEPQTSLREGLKKLKDWYLEQGVPPEQLLEDEIIHNWTEGNR